MDFSCKNIRMNVDVNDLPVLGKLKTTVLLTFGSEVHQLLISNNP
jgi:hypothetical protein